MQKRVLTLELAFPRSLDRRKCRLGLLGGKREKEYKKKDLEEQAAQAWRFDGKGKSGGKRASPGYDKQDIWARRLLGDLRTCIEASLSRGGT